MGLRHVTIAAYATSVPGMGMSRTPVHTRPPPRNSPVLPPRSPRTHRAQGGRAGRVPWGRGCLSVSAEEPRSGWSRSQSSRSWSGSEGGGTRRLKEEEPRARGGAPRRASGLGGTDTPPAPRTLPHHPTSRSARVRR
eukprot:3382711-Rhodomonas_salina.2